MRAIFGIVSLLVALAIVGMLAAHQLKAVKRGAPAAGVTATTGEGAMSQPAPAGNVREQAQQLQQQVQRDVSKALEQGAQRSQDASEK